MEKRESKRFLVTALGEEVRGKWTRVDCGCCVYVYIYICVYASNKKNGQIPHGKSTTFSHVRTTAIFDLSEKASKAYQSLTR